MYKNVFLGALFFVSIFSSKTLQAQEVPKVVVFNQSTEEDKWMTPHNILKLSLLEMFAGDISMYYERVLGENIAAEVGVGMTIDDYLGSAIFDDEFGAVSDDVQQLIGHSFGAGFRYYPYAASDEFYFGPEFKYRFYHTLYNVYDGTASPQSFEEQKRVISARMTVGYNLWLDDNIDMDFYAGIGLNVYKLREYEAVYDQNTGIYAYQERNISRPRPWLTLGLKFGFGFR